MADEASINSIRSAFLKFGKNRNIPAWLHLFTFVQWLGIVGNYQDDTDLVSFRSCKISKKSTLRIELQQTVTYSGLTQLSLARCEGHFQALICGAYKAIIIVVIIIVIIQESHHGGDLQATRE